MAWSYVVTDRYQTHYSYSNNAEEVYTFLNARGYTHEAIIGVLANMEHESCLNPGQQEHGYNGSVNRGYGLVQWTPARDKILAYANRLGVNWYDGNVQMDYFMINVPASWIKSGQFHYSYDEFKRMTDIYLATRTFFWNFERGTWHSDLDDYAYYWDYYFQGGHTPPPTPTPPTPPPPRPDSPSGDDLMMLLIEKLSKCFT